MSFFTQSDIYWSVHHLKMHGKDRQSMDEYELPAPADDLTCPTGDVDDLIFCHDPEWYVSER